MTIRQEIEQALAVIENHRDILDPEVVETAVAALQDKLLALQSVSPPEIQKRMAVLVADLSGFTAMSEMMDAEDVRDTINAIWQKLDGVITAWGGQIDQHIGDAVVALFAVKSNLADCVERAVLSALDMQRELAQFNEKQQKDGHTGRLIRLRTNLDLRMRIGIHLGPVVFGKVGSSLQYTAVGDTISITNLLEQAAPVGGILISDAIYDQIHQNFETRPVPPISVPSEAEHIPAHAVHQEKQHMLQNIEREISPHETRFVGRTTELEHLQFALEEVLESGAAMVVTVSGETGIGKTRLRQEFEKFLAIQPTPIHLFKGQAETEIASGDYAVMHCTFANFFDIHPRSSQRVAQTKLVEGVLNILSTDDIHARERAHFIGHLLGFNLDQSPYLQNFKHDARRVREYAFQDLALFFAAVSEDRPTVVLLDDMERADSGSFEVVEYLVDVCRERPLLIVCFGEKQLLEKWTTLRLHRAIQPERYRHIDLSPLSLIDNRHLIADCLQNIPRLPQRLTDLLAEAADGNPFLITELIEMLGDIGVIIKGSQQWRVQMSPLNDLRGKLNLIWLIDKHLERSNPLEKEILQKAAIIGEMFWQSTITAFFANENNTVTDRQIRAALYNLEQQELITRQWPSIFPKTNEYRFRHRKIQQTIYHTIPQAERQTLHAQCAVWLLDQQATHLPHIFDAIAAHLEKAGDAVAASNWYGRAADQASHNYTPNTAIQLYQQALTLLPQTEQYTSRRNQLAEGLGQVLRQQSRFDAAITLYGQLYRQSVDAQDMDTAVRAFRSLFIICNFQGEHHAALKTAQEVEKIARSRNNAQELAIALVAQSWAYTYLGKMQQALAISKKALNISINADAKRETAYCHALIGTIARYLHQFDQAQKATKTAIALFREIGDRPWRVLMLHSLGRIAWMQQDFAQAERHFSQGLRMARDMGDPFGAIRNLHGLSALAQKQHDYEQAEHYAQQTLIWAEKSGNLRFKVLAAIDLSQIHLTQQEVLETAVAQTEQRRLARYWLEQAQEEAQQIRQPLPYAIWQIEMARLLLAEQKPAPALTQILSALQLIREQNIEALGFSAQKTVAIAWRELANITAQLPPTSLPIFIENQPYQVADCYQKSLQIFSKIKNGAKIEAARTLFAWAVYEIRADHHERGELLWQRAHEMYTQLGLTDEIAKMERFAL
ncbi:MAG: tetratricopeptide repeat protein [Ardenticatenaceae bacterium]|nr:tetratricopeptide repeat protein [Ardenticatenaceae bacterium]MCB9443280.1 tetratricopeptide repeat protein [Ardenticatenaceae bacterium]